MARAYQLMVKVDGSTKGAIKALGKLENRAGKFSSKMRSAGKLAATGLIAVGAASIVAGAKMVSLASDANEVDSKLQAVFGDKRMGKMKKNLDAFSAATGASKFELREAAANMGALINPMKLGAKETDRMSEGMVKLATDLASFHNVPMEEALEKVRSGLMGEAEPMRAFGVQLSMARIKTEALRLGLVAEGEELTAGAKAQAAYSLMVEDTVDAKGDAIKTADSMANVMKALKNKVKDTATELGMALLPAAQNVALAFRDFVNSDRFKQWIDDVGVKMQELSQRFTDYVNSDKFKAHMIVVKDNTEKVWNVLKKLASVVADNKGKIILLGAALMTLDLAVKAVKLGVMAFHLVLKGIIVAKKLWAAAQWALNVALNANPIGLVVLAVAALAAGIYVAIRYTDQVKTAIKVMAKVAMFHIKLIPIYWLYKGILKVIAKTGLVQAAFRKLKDNAVPAWNRIKDAVKSVADWIQTLIEKADRAIQKIKNIKPPNISNPLWDGALPGFAHGGIATSPSIFGEAGPEMAIPLSPSKRGRALDLLGQTSAMLGGGGGGVTVNQYFSGEPDPFVAARAMRAELSVVM